MYGTVGGTMKKTTLYLPDELKSAVERAAAEEQRSEAEIIREAIRRAVEVRPRPRPRVPLTSRGLGDPRASERCEELLDGFGER